MKTKGSPVQKEKKSNDLCRNYQEYEWKLKYARAKLHGRYLVCISVGIMIWLLATGQSNTEEFSDWVSFASTITSIILSVIAIIMSISGESKTDSMREKIEETVKKLENTAEQIEIASKANIECINEVKERVDELNETLKRVPDMTVESMQKSYGLSNINDNNKENSQKGWLEDEK